MLFRLMLLLNILGLSVGPDARDDDELGGQGFGNVVHVFVLIGVVVLIGLVVLGVLSLTGTFEMDHFDPTK